MQRRLLISMLCLSLAGLAPVPLSACAMLMAAPSGCGPAAADLPASTSHCEQAFAAKETNQHTLQPGTSELPCCKLTAAPIPDTGAGISKVNFAPAYASLEVAPQAIAVKTPERTAAQIDLEQFASPPDKQPLLCTFLI